MTAQITPPPASQQTSPMKRAGQLVAHLSVLHQIRDLRQLMLLQFVMSGRQDQAALFRREGDGVTLSVIGSQPALTGPELTHRSGNVPAEALFSQLQTLSGIQGDDVAFSAGQITQLISARTAVIEEGDDLAKLDEALSAMVSRGLPDEHQTEAHPSQAQATGQHQTPPAERHTHADDTHADDALVSADRPEPVPAEADLHLSAAEASTDENGAPLPETAADTDADEIAESAQASGRRGTRRTG